MPGFDVAAGDTDRGRAEKAQPLGGRRIFDLDGCARARRRALRLRSRLDRRARPEPRLASPAHAAGRGARRVAARGKGRLLALTEVGARLYADAARDELPTRVVAP